MLVGENWGISGGLGNIPQLSPTFLCKAKVIRWVGVKSFGCSKMNLYICCEYLPQPKPHLALYIPVNPDVYPASSDVRN